MSAIRFPRVLYLFYDILRSQFIQGDTLYLYFRKFYPLYILSSKTHFLMSKKEKQKLENFYENNFCRVFHFLFRILDQKWYVIRFNISLFYNVEFLKNRFHNCCRIFIYYLFLIEHIWGIIIIIIIYWLE